jgi:uncharacterized protein YgbK (DUF1537 family)
MAAAARMQQPGRRSVRVVRRRVAEATDGPARRATERGLAEIAVETGTSERAHLVLIGGDEPRRAWRLGAGELIVHGRFDPLIADAEIATGTALGVRLVTKGGSGGEPDALAALLRGGVRERVGAAAPGTL